MGIRPTSAAAKGCSTLPFSRMAESRSSPRVCMARHSKKFSKNRNRAMCPVCHRAGFRMPLLSSQPQCSHRSWS